jgi:hypothetical protein
MSRTDALPDPGYLRDIAAQLRNRAQSAAPSALREQLLELAEYYDGMAATVPPPVMAPPPPR